MSEIAVKDTPKFQSELLGANRGRCQQAVGNYWINAVINNESPTHNLNLNSTLSRGVLRYEGALDEEPQTPLTEGPTGTDGVMLHEWEIVPLDPIPAPEPDFNFTFNTSMLANITAWQINNVSYIPPSVPTLVRVLQGETQQMDFNETENTFLFPTNKTIQVEIIDARNEGHPFHLHGMNIWVIKSNGSDIINTINPIRRDVCNTGNGTIILRFRTDKPGPWSFHCHSKTTLAVEIAQLTDPSVLYHFAVGLGSVIGAGLDKVGKVVHTTEAWKRLCPAYDALPPGEQ
ncbi:Cupredoxin [Mycena leptocephala]|nr:Cupredoxin [Mycena leptocephala]